VIVDVEGPDSVLDRDIDFVFSENEESETEIRDCTAPISSYVEKSLSHKNFDNITCPQIDQIKRHCQKVRDLGNKKEMIDKNFMFPMPQLKKWDDIQFREVIHEPLPITEEGDQKPEELEFHSQDEFKTGDIVPTGAPVSNRRLCAPETGAQPKSSSRIRFIPGNPTPEEHMISALETTHPIDRESQVPKALRRVIEHNAKLTPNEINAHRELSEVWLHKKAWELRHENDVILAKCEPSVLKVLVKKNFTVHVALMRYLTRVSGHVDQKFAEIFPQGLPIIGEIPASGLWPKIPDEEAWKSRITIDQLHAKRDDLLTENRQRQKSSEHDADLWKATLKDLDPENGFADGPFYSEEEVGEFLGTQDFFTAPRFVCLQPRPKFLETMGDEGVEAHRELVMEVKPRSIDDGDAAGLNDATIVFEKLKCATPDEIAATARLLREFFPGNL